MFSVRYEQYWFRLALQQLGTQINPFFYVKKRFFCVSSLKENQIISVDFKGRGVENKEELKTVSKYRRNEKNQKLYDLTIFI